MQAITQIPHVLALILAYYKLDKHSLTIVIRRILGRAHDVDASKFIDAANIYVKYYTNYMIRNYVCDYNVLYWISFHMPVPNSIGKPHLIPNMYMYKMPSHPTIVKCGNKMLRVDIKYVETLAVENWLGQNILCDHLVVENKVLAPLPNGLKKLTINSCQLKYANFPPTLKWISLRFPNRIPWWNEADTITTQECSGPRPKSINNIRHIYQHDLYDFLSGNIINDEEGRIYRKHRQHNLKSVHFDEHEIHIKVERIKPEPLTFLPTVLDRGQFVVINFENVESHLISEITISAIGKAILILPPNNRLGKLNIFGNVIIECSKTLSYLNTFKCSGIAQWLDIENYAPMITSLEISNPKEINGLHIKSDSLVHISTHKVDPRNLKIECPHLIYRSHMINEARHGYAAIIRTNYWRIRPAMQSPLGKIHGGGAQDVSKKCFERLKLYQLKNKHN